MDRDVHRRLVRRRGQRRLGTLSEFSSANHPVIAVVVGVALAFFAMTAPLNAANVAEETVTPSRAFPRAPSKSPRRGHLGVPGRIATALTVPTDTQAQDAALLEVVEVGIIRVRFGFMTILIRHHRDDRHHDDDLHVVVNTVADLYDMAKEDVVPVHPGRSTTRGEPFFACVSAAAVS